MERLPNAMTVSKETVHLFSSPLARKEQAPREHDTGDFHSHNSTCVVCCTPPPARRPS